MTNRTETCTPAERRFLDLLWQAVPMNMDANHNELRLAFSGWPFGCGSGHETAKAFYEAHDEHEGEER